MRQSAKRYEVRVDTCFARVIRACADPSREDGWISEDFITAYTRLHDLGWAHSVEVFDRRRSAGWRPLRRPDQRAVRRRIDVPSRAGRVESRADGAGRFDADERHATARRSVVYRSSRIAWRGSHSPPGVPRETGGRRISERPTGPRRSFDPDRSHAGLRVVRRRRDALTAARANSDTANGPPLDDPCFRAAKTTATPSDWGADTMTSMAAVPLRFVGT